MKFNVKDFLGFKMMVTPKIIKWFFIIISALVVLGAVIGGFIFLVTMTANSYNSFAGFFLGALGFVGVLIGAVIYLVIFRMSCEFIVVMFSIHTELIQINKKAGPMPDCCQSEPAAACCCAPAVNPPPVAETPAE